MKIDKSHVEHVAQLARLQFEEDDLEIFVKQLDEILNYFDKLQDLDTSNVEPTAHVVGISNVFRDDVVQEFADKDLILEGAPEPENSYFRVPKVIE